MSLLPVTCFSCNKTIAHLWSEFIAQRTQNPDPQQIHIIMDRLGLRRYCCRRMFVTHCDMSQKIYNYSEMFNTFNSSQIKTKTQTIPERTYVAR